jgi:hypothetical protein
VITGAVAITIQLIPTNASTPATSIPAKTVVTSSESRASSEPGEPSSDALVVVKAMIGKWKGTARNTSGETFPITLEISNACAPGLLCGVIGVPAVPCYGQIYLQSVNNGEVEFRVDNFDKRSNATCQSGAGEHFRLRGDGKLAYRTTYDPIAQGTLTRT